MLISEEIPQVQLLTGGTMSSDFRRIDQNGQSILLKENRYKNQEDLRAALKVNELDSYLIPELNTIRENIKSSKLAMQKRSAIKNEFE